MNPSLRPDGRVVWDPVTDCEPIEWASLPELAADYWRYQRRSDRERERMHPNPWDCVSDWMLEPAPGWVDLLTALVESATDDEVAMVGVHCVEDLLIWHGDNEAIIGAIEQWVRRSPRARQAISALFVSSDLDPAVAVRLRRLGAT